MMQDATNVIVTTSGKGHPIRPRGNALSAIQITQELYGSLLPGQQGNTIPIVRSIDLSLIPERSNHSQTTDVKEEKTRPETIAGVDIIMTPEMVQNSIDDYLKWRGT